MKTRKGRHANRFAAYNMYISDAAEKSKSFSSERLAFEPVTIEAVTAVSHPGTLRRRADLGAHNNAAQKIHILLVGSYLVGI